MKRLAKVVVNAWFWGVFAVTLPWVTVVAAGLWLVTFPFDSSRAAVHAWMSLCTSAYLKLNPGWCIRFEGRQRLPKGAFIAIANHQSMADIPVMMALRFPFKFVSKASLFSVPFVGWTMSMARYVRIERGRVHSTQKMFEECRTWLRRGVPLVIFPEGTYAPAGQMLPFKSGAFRLAMLEKVPLIPIVVTGTPSLVFDDGPWLEPRCQVAVRVLPPLEPPRPDEDASALSARAQGVFVQLLMEGSRTREASRLG